MSLSKLTGIRPLQREGKMPRALLSARQQRLLSALLVFFLAVTLWTAAYVKTFAFHEFEQVLTFSRLIPAWLARSIAVLIMTLEYGLPLLLAMPRTRTAGLLGTTGLFTAFAAYSAWRIVARVGVPCTCFAGLFTLSPVTTLLLDLGSLAVCGILLAMERDTVRPFLTAIGTWFRQTVAPRLPVGRFGRTYVSVTVLTSFLLLCLTAGKLLSFVGRDPEQKPDKDARQVEVLPATRASVVGSAGTVVGKSEAPYVLVEFGDYQCPPCRAHVRMVEELQARYPDRLGVVFRHFPLTEIHPDAFRAALLAETARRAGRFSEAHRLLMTGSIDEAGVRAAARYLGLEKTLDNTSQEDTARQIVRRDRTAAQALGLNSTPSFLLCLPDGRVLHLPDLASADPFLNRSEKQTTH
jgi:protein-disulfide isomerase